MKNSTGKFKWTGLFAMLLTLLAFLPTNGNAQVCVYVASGADCPVEITWTSYYGGGGCTSICSTGGPITILPGAPSTPISCGGCSICNVAITIVSIGGVAVTTTPADFSSTSPGIAYPSGVCFDDSGNPSIEYVPNVNSFIIRR